MPAENTDHQIERLRSEYGDVLSGLSVEGECRGVDTNMFYLDTPIAIEIARQVCGQCAVRSACLDFAINTREEYGVWGGVSAPERKNIRRREQRLARTERIRQESNAENNLS